MTFRKISRPRVLTIAGHDPSGGAGLSADLKVMEAWGVQGLSVCTALTVQNASTFLTPGWVPWEQIEAQLIVLHAEQKILYYKIGLIENAVVLQQVVCWIRERNPTACIVWDPILSATAGFSFHGEGDRQHFRAIASQLSLITPNAKEAEWLGTDLPCPLLVKGGHGEGDYCVDHLLVNGRTHSEFSHLRIAQVAKHGTGCVLSASIISLLAQGLSLERACRVSRELLQNYLTSTTDLLGAMMPSLPVVDVARSLDVLYAITWDGAGKSHEQQVRELCEAGVGLIQLRMKQVAASERIAVAQNCLRICRQWGSLLVINDDVELAFTVGAPAVHLGLGDMPVRAARVRLGDHVLIGGTANTTEQVMQRVADGADYVGLGPWRHTFTKEKLSPVLGADGLRKVFATLRPQFPHFPVYVIGGVESIHGKEILELGATGVAVSSALVAQANTLERVQEFRRALCGQGVHS